MPGQELLLKNLERIALHLGPSGSVTGHPHIAQLRRDADETTKLFAETWHSDWSFLPSPPQAALLYGNVNPLVGGDTLFANQNSACETLPSAMQALRIGSPDHANPPDRLRTSQNPGRADPVQSRPPRDGA